MNDRAALAGKAQFSGRGTTVWIGAITDSGVGDYLTHAGITFHCRIIATIAIVATQLAKWAASAQELAGFIAGAVIRTGTRAAVVGTVTGLTGHIALGQRQAFF